MADVLVNQRRQLWAAQRETADSDLEQTPTNLVEEDLAAGENARSQGRVLQRQQQAAKQKSAAENVEGKIEEVVQEQVKATAKQNTLRIINAVCGSTIVLFFVTVLIWTFQFIAGNLLGSKVVPALKIWEIILWLASLFLLLGAILLIATIISFMVRLSQFDWDAIKILGQGLWDAFKGAFGL